MTDERDKFIRKIAMDRMTQLKKSDLPQEGQSLIELMQSINYGRIEGLAVRRGQPVLAPPPRVVREIKFGGENGRRPEIAKSNFMLRGPVRDLFGIGR